MKLKEKVQEHFPEVATMRGGPVTAAEKHSGSQGGAGHVEAGFIFPLTGDGSH